MSLPLLHRGWHGPCSEMLTSRDDHPPAPNTGPQEHCAWSRCRGKCPGEWYLALFKCDCSRRAVSGPGCALGLAGGPGSPQVAPWGARGRQGLHTSTLRGQLRALQPPGWTVPMAMTADFHPDACVSITREKRGVTPPRGC